MARDKEFIYEEKYEPYFVAVMEELFRRVSSISEALAKEPTLIAKVGKPKTIIGKTVIAEPDVGHTQTFLSAGAFDNRLEAENCNKYLQTKFCQAMLSTKKVTQHNARDTWEFVPLQDFTANSDIDWSVSIAQIDAQLYAKYNLDWKEIAFIEGSFKYREG